jgi:hypothetical protein
LGWSNEVEEPAVPRLPRQTACAIGKSFAFVTALGLLLFWIPAMASAQAVSKPENDAQKQLNNLTTSLANGSVASVDILHMPDRMDTLTSVTPEDMERWWECRITISKVKEWAGRDDLAEINKVHESSFRLANVRPKFSSYL